MNTKHPNKRERTTGLLNAAFLALYLFLSGSPVHAQTVSCGSVIGPNAEVSLQADIGPCDDQVTAALTIVGPATVNLTDSVVICRDADRDGLRPVGIVVAGEGVTLRNGGVDSCRIGVQVTGNGKHQIENVLVGESQQDGFTVASNANTLLSNHARGNGSAGFRVLGTGNKAVQNQATGNISGFRIDGTTHTLTNNHASTQVIDGFVIFANNSTLTDNTAKSNGSRGFFVGGRFSILRRNEAERNTSSGFVIGGSRGTFSHNIAFQNRGHGFSIAGQLQGLSRNTAAENHANGFRVTQGSAITLSNNLADLHGSNGISVGLNSQEILVTENTVTRSLGLDLEDQNVNCGTNRWQRNSFRTSNQPCVQ